MSQCACAAVARGQGLLLPRQPGAAGRPGQRGHHPRTRDQRARRGSAGRRPYAFDEAAYRGRNIVERAFNRLKQWRGIAARYDKTAINYRAGILLASVIIWLTT